MSDSFRPHELQHARSPCPSPTPRVHPNPCPLSWWCHPTVSFSVVPIWRAVVHVLLKLHVHLVGDAIQPSLPLLSPSPPALNLSQHQGLFKWVISWPKYWSLSFNISPTNEHPGLIPFRMDWLDLLAVHGTLKSLLQHHSSGKQHPAV